MGTDEVIRKTLALAQSQLSNYKAVDLNRAVSGVTKSANQGGVSRVASQTTTAGRQPSKSR